MATSLAKHLPNIRCPMGGEKVYKDECAYSCDTPECKTGLYICMNSFVGLGERYVEQHYIKSNTKNAVFLHYRRLKKELPKKAVEEEDKPTRLAIGVEGGFAGTEQKYEFEHIYSVVVLPEWARLQLEDPALPSVVQVSAAGIIEADSAAKAEEAAQLAGMWDGEVRVISKFADNLPQNPPTKKIPPQGWKCERCDLTTNLWLNLTDGSILCGRRFWDGSGGNNHAIEHYQEVKHPLAVKLGTITSSGGDVYSYAEDDMVLDPHLAMHLAHWGINIANMEKTDKTMTELELDLNQRIGEWDVIQEAGSELKPCYGPSYTGLHNLGNSCYMNSVLQVMASLPSYQNKYFGHATQVVAQAPIVPVDDFNTQMFKLFSGLLSGDYSAPEEPMPESATEPITRYQRGVRPAMFKSLVGRGHPEFSTKRQQDAQEFLLYLINLVEKNSRGSDNANDPLRFRVEDRLECEGKVKYSVRDEFILSLPIPLHAATNKDEVKAYEERKKKEEHLDPKQLVRPRIPLSSCLEVFAAEELIEDFLSPVSNSKTIAKKSSRLSTFPDFLFVQMKKFTLGEDWVPKKLDVSLDMPGELDLSYLRGQGLRPGEEQMSSDAPAAQQPQGPVVDEAVLIQLVDMGFPREACRKAIVRTQNTGVEAAMNWIMEHMADPDFEVPLPAAAVAPISSFTPNEDSVSMIMAMGFSRPQAVKALQNTDNNVERAADWIFSHADELEAPMETNQPLPQQAENVNNKYTDGTGKYKLVAFISHMGTSTLVGHYVCHILKEGRWVIYNDEKVALSERPPKDLAYLYLYQRAG